MRAATFRRWPGRRRWAKPGKRGWISGPIPGITRDTTFSQDRPLILSASTPTASTPTGSAQARARREGRVVGSLATLVAAVCLLPMLAVVRFGERERAEAEGRPVKVRFCSDLSSSGANARTPAWSFKYVTVRTLLSKLKRAQVACIS